MKTHQGLLLVMISLFFGMYSMENPHKRERGQEIETSKQPQLKKKKIFSSEEIKKATEALIQAIKDNDIEKAQQALDQGANKNAIYSGAFVNEGMYPGLSCSSQ